MAVTCLQEKIALHRDQQAYKKLFLHYYKGLTAFALTTVKTREAAEEVVSDVMLNVWLLKEDLLQVNNLEVYLYRATRNRAINYVARAAKYQFVEMKEHETEELASLHPDLLFEKAEWNQHLAVVINRLSPKCGTAYKLVKEEGLSYRQVAAIMCISENTVDRHLNNALHKLVKAMKQYMEIEIKRQ